MNFIGLNGRKVLLRLLINISITSIIALTGYAIILKHGNPPGETQVMLIVVYIFGMLWFLLFYYAGRHAFRVSGRLLRYVVAYNVFDDKEYFFAFLDKDSPYLYTRRCLCGKIGGYPVIVTFNLATGKGQVSKIDFEFITT
jgi:hypothetical protein